MDFPKDRHFLVKRLVFIYWMGKWRENGSVIQEAWYNKELNKYDYWHGSKNIRSTDSFAEEHIIAWYEIPNEWI